MNRSPCYKVDIYDRSVSCINWAYTIDLDNEVFSVGNRSHCKLDQLLRGDACKNFVAMDGYAPSDTVVNVVPDLKSGYDKSSIPSEYQFRVFS